VKEKSLQAIIEAVQPMLNSRLDNYIVPGLVSELVGGEVNGKVRLFHTNRTATDFVTPHSHRFDFTCLVLKGIVRNTLFVEGGETGDEWCASSIDQVCGADGLLNYTHTREAAPTRWTQDTHVYEAGDTYSMRFDEIHSIQFSRGTKVLFFEGPWLTRQSRMIEPWVGGRVVPTFKTESWMFQRSTAVAAM
jgi:hypothetical protein